MSREQERIRQESGCLEERARIARELHDTFLQTVQSASLQLDAALYSVGEDASVKSRLERIHQLMRQAVEESRRAIDGLRSPEPDTSHLAPALSRVQEEVYVEPGVDFRVMVTGRKRASPPHIQNEIYRIGREALLNAFLHSGAKLIELHLDYFDTGLHMLIRDNGGGIDPQLLESGRVGHWGLAGMRERAARIGGLINILSRPTVGTEVQLTVQCGPQ